MLFWALFVIVILASLAGIGWFFRNEIAQDMGDLELFLAQAGEMLEPLLPYALWALGGIALITLAYWRRRWLYDYLWRPIRRTGRFLWALPSFMWRHFRLDKRLRVWRRATMRHFWRILSFRSRRSARSKRRLRLKARYRKGWRGFKKRIARRWQNWKERASARSDWWEYIAPIISFSFMAVFLRVSANGFFSWIEKWVGLGQPGLLLLSLSLVVLFYVSASFFANASTNLRNGPLTSPEEGSSIGVVAGGENEGGEHEGGEFIRMVTNMKGMGHGHPDLAEDSPRTRLLRKSLNNDVFDDWYMLPMLHQKNVGEILFGKTWLLQGVRWVGPYPWRRKKLYAFSWISPTPNEPEKMKVHARKMLAHAYTKRVQYVYPIENIEVAGGIPCNIVILVTGELVNPGRAIFRMGRQGSWLDALLGEIGGDLQRALIQRTYEEIAGGKPKAVTTTKRNKKTGTKELTIADHLEVVRKAFEVELIRYFGFWVTKIELLSIDPTPEYRQLTTDVRKKEIGADAARAESKGKADSRRIEAKGEADALASIDKVASKLNPNTLQLKALELLGKPGVNPTFVTPNVGGVMVMTRPAEATPPAPATPPPTTPPTTPAPPAGP